MGVRKILHITRTFLRALPSAVIGQCRSSRRGKTRDGSRIPLTSIYKRRAADTWCVDYTPTDSCPGLTSRQRIERIDLKLIFFISI